MTKPRFIQNEKEFLELASIAFSIKELNKEEVLENKNEKIFFDCSDFCSKGFPEFLIFLLELFGEHKFYVSVLAPDPIKYFFKHFHKYPILEISIDTSPKDYFAALNEDPGGSPADALAFNSERYAIYSSSFDWYIYADRRLDICFLSTENKNNLEKLKLNYPLQLISYEELVRNI